MNLTDVKKSDIREYLSARYGIVCDVSGKASCPLHPPDNKKSFSVMKKDGGAWHWHCFHDDKGGTIIDLKMQLEGLTKKEACNQLMKELCWPTKKVGLSDQAPMPKTKNGTAPKKKRRPGIHFIMTIKTRPERFHIEKLRSSIPMAARDISFSIRLKASRIFGIGLRARLRIFHIIWTCSRTMKTSLSPRGRKTPIPSTG